MKVKMILPALAEANSRYFRPIKYSLFPPLGLATLAGHLAPDDEIDIQDEHVESLFLDDRPDLVVIQVYITAACRAYQLADHYRAKGAYVALGGLHVTALPLEALAHADSVFLGPGDDTWPLFLKDYKAGSPARVYRSTKRTLEDLPPARRDLLKRHLYLVPNSLVVTRGCPHHCAFCYKDSFFRGGRSFYTARVDKALREIEGLPGKHLYFLDDNLLADAGFSAALFDGMKGMGRVFQAAGTVGAVLNPSLLAKAADAGLKSLFIGFETLNKKSLRAHDKVQNIGASYERAIGALHERGIMVNASFVFGMDGDDPTVFDRTVDWAIEQGIETSTFHILTPYPGTKLFESMQREGRITSLDWDSYDTRHCVYKPRGMTAEELVAGYWRAYHRFYRWKSIVESALVKSTFERRMRHLAYAGGWKKAEPLWHLLIKGKQVCRMLPLLESILSLGVRRENRAKCQSAEHSLCTQVS